MFIQNFAAGEVDERPQSGVFFACTTMAGGAGRSAASLGRGSAQAAEELDLSIR